MSAEVTDQPARRQHPLGFDVDACSFQPEQWDEFPGIEGMVMLCNTHGHPGIGVYHFPPEQAVGTCNAVEYPPSLVVAADPSTPNRLDAQPTSEPAQGEQWGLRFESVDGTTAEQKLRDEREARFLAPRMPGVVLRRTGPDAPWEDA